MANQYCKLTSWIEHNDKHKDPLYAQAILDLCLDSYLKPGKYHGLTFLYQTDAKIRKKFCDKVFSASSRELCDEFKRYILPDTFLSCEDFQSKDVGNILGKKYEVESCDKDTVTFTNGMKIKAIENNSYDPLSTNLKDIVKIYYVIKGEPPKDGDHYTISHRKRQTKSSKSVGGGSSRLIRGGTSEEFEEVYTSSNLGELIKTITHENIKNNGNKAFHVALDMLCNKLNPPNHTEVSSEHIGVSDNISSNDIFGDTHEKNHVDKNDENHVDENHVDENHVDENHVDENSGASGGIRYSKGGNTELKTNIQNVILVQWLVNTIPEGIIAYIYMCLFILYKAQHSDEFRMFINDLIVNVLNTLVGTSSHGVTGEYLEVLSVISKDLGFVRGSPTEATLHKLHSYVDMLKKSSIQQNLIDQFYTRITTFSTIWGGTFIPTFFGDMSTDIPKYGTYLGLWVITLFSISSLEVDFPGKMDMLNNEFIGLIRANSTEKVYNTEHIFSPETLHKFIGHPQSSISNDNAIEETVAVATGLVVSDSGNNIGSSDSIIGGMFD